MERQHEPPSFTTAAHNAYIINSVLRGVSLMQALQPQRPCESATATTHRKYNAILTHDEACTRLHAFRFIVSALSKDQISRGTFQ